jgi:hypothetical protein
VQHPDKSNTKHEVWNPIVGFSVENIVNIDNFNDPAQKTSKEKGENLMQQFSTLKLEAILVAHTFWREISTGIVFGTFFQ